MLLNVNQVMTVLNCGKSRAYNSIKLLNAELQKAGYLTIQGRVPAEYLADRYKLDEEEVRKQIETMDSIKA
ncbi:hypothetical protein [Anaerococcus prevotii]|uniref:Uncharacterized protein n=1 Tax=Anaerococcus prevotii ACS-065-V-Col13 TaxID=879305 RepID=F0GU36_9FIRM|nr:hypothetical protein [Anaerococcus prevotii]EGC82415.1 hypothetical protein HMPREF9290_1255 [Anaerococcus prevotii ACS-065-V-Col13]